MNTHEYYLTLDIARKARTAGNHPFGVVLMQAGNAYGDVGDCIAHADRVLMTRASQAQ